MIDFIEYIVSELKSKRLSKSNALGLINQFSRRPSKLNSSSIIHPLVEKNTSDLSQQSYQTLLTGEEFYLSDHRVAIKGENGICTLPGVAYLEMARAAIEDALPDLNNQKVLELYNVMWLQPLMVTKPTKAKIALFASEMQGDQFEQIEFEIYTDESQDIVHCQGQANVRPRPENVVFDLSKLKQQMTSREISDESVYAAFKKLGLIYGSAHQGVKKIFVGKQALLAELRLPEALEVESNQYFLHPSILDSALQSSIGLLSDLDNLPNQPSLPFAIESLRVLSRCTNKMFAWVRYSAGSHADDNIVKLDIDLCDSSGKVCVQIRSFSSRVLKQLPDTSDSLLKNVESILATPAWVEKPAVQDTSIQVENSQSHKLWLLDFAELKTTNLKELEPKVDCHHLKVQSTDIALQYTEVAKICFDMLQTVIKEKPSRQVLIQLVIPANQANYIYSGLAAMFKTARLENPNIIGQVIFVKPEITSQRLIRLLHQEWSVNDQLIKYIDNKRLVLAWDELTSSAISTTNLLKEQGVYLITGGLGKIGGIFAKEILNKTSGAKVVLSGRSYLDDKQWQDKKMAILDEQSTDIERLDYRQLDLSDINQVSQFIQSVMKDYSQLNGIIHCSGMTSDSYILNKSFEEFSQVLQPKVAGSFNLDNATKNIDLDFFALCSSAVSVSGNVGQADYAVANGFMDFFAEYRNSQVRIKQRTGKTVSFNWPLWQQGGMKIDPQSMEMLEQTAGIYPMATNSGLKAFYRGLLHANNQCLVAEGDGDKIKKVLLNHTSDETVASGVDANAKFEHQDEIEALSEKNDPIDIVESLKDKGDTQYDLNDKTQQFLRKQLSQVLKIPSTKIDVKAPLENYGIDSILAMNLTSLLEKTFGSLSKTLLFEYRSVLELSQYFINSHKTQLEKIFSDRPGRAKPTEDDAAKEKSYPNKEKSAALVPQNSVRKTRRRGLVKQSSVTYPSNWLSSKNEAIAIVGMSGRYPDSDDLDEYWTNLQQGHDCISEVPDSRWNWRDFYSEDRTQIGRHYSKWGGFINGVDEFDPKFFNISPREAVTIDPQERLFLQFSWKAIEDAGYTRDSLQIAREKGLAGQVGVYVGVMYGEYNLSGSLASVANRVSSVLNLHGPSMTLDTMCSSSLTAIHLASQDLKNGRTDLAIAGGVNITINPSKYMMLSAGQFISSTGHCQSFGEGGDGYIPGEGVGVVILKRLSEAEKDGQHIYAVIKGSSLNHGGKTNGYTVPNPQAQADVIREAIVESQVPAHHVSYIEAHGTGTKLGDPIEIAALNSAFNGKNNNETSGANKNTICLVGSAKSNIGHCESAAGIAGLTKIILQMKFKQIVPSLHSKQLNPHIDFDQTPFVVNQSLTEWEQGQEQGRAIPRTAGLSSFGAGGSNAHFIIQEHPLNDLIENELSEINGEVILPISARTIEQLQQKLIDLKSFIISRTENLNLLSMAYTLQLGREHMTQRISFVVSNVKSLLAKISAYTDGEEGVEDVYSGQVESDASGMSLISDDDDMKQAIERWIERKKFSKLADLWVKGLELDWKKLYLSDHRPNFMSLPGYPFAKEKYWMDTSTTGPLAVSKVDSNDKHTVQLHPLVHQNTSNFERQRFCSSFNGINPFKSILSGTDDSYPGLLLLELLRVGIELSTSSGRRDTNQATVELRKIKWGQPFYFKSQDKLNLELFNHGELTENNEYIEFEIYSGTTNEIVHCQGEALTEITEPPNHFDILQLKKELTTIDTQVADLLNGVGETGSIYQGENQLLASLQVDNFDEEEQKYYLFHPTIALKTSIVIETFLKRIAGEDNSNWEVVALDSVKFNSACNKSMSVYIRYSGTGKVDQKTRLLDVDVIDGNGQCCIELRGLAVANIVEGAILAEPKISNAVKLEMPAIDHMRPSLTISKPKGIGLVNLQKLDKIQSDLLGTTLKQKLLVAPGSVRIKPAEQQTEKLIAIDTPEGERINKIGNKEVVAERNPSKEFSFIELQQKLQTSLADALYMEQSEIELEKSFIDLGLDSIVGVEWVNEINKQFSLQISATRVYDYSNIKELATFLQQQLSQIPEASLSSMSASKEESRVLDSDKLVVDKEVADKAVSKQVKSSRTTITDLEQQLRQSLADALYMEVADVDLIKSFVDLGLDSIVGVEWVNSINKQYQLEISATRVYDYSNIKELAVFLKGELGEFVEPITAPLQQFENKLQTPQQEPASGLLLSEPNSLELHQQKVFSSYPQLVRKLGKNKAKVATPSNSIKSAKQIPQYSVAADEKVAIVGMSGRYPQAENLDIYWENLIKGKNSVSEIPKTRWNVDSYFDPEPKQGKIYCKWLGMLDDIDCFDPLFFQISPSEAEIMDPQHRLFLQESYRAFEDAGYSSENLSNMKCGVYLGIMSSEYSYLLAKSNDVSVETTGNSFAIGAARIAYYLNLKGPAIPIDTACSSSLVAIHLGSQALLNNEVDMALAGGVSLYVIPESYVGMCRAGMLSPQGQCKTFDNSADGFVPGEGVGAVVLKRLQDAKKDKDYIHAVILGSGINQDGKTNGITAPSVNSQIELEREIYSKYNIDPKTINYVETHGTGTKLGDPIELEALATVFKEKTSQKHYCALGAVKSNIGHTSGAAGVASVHKVLLSMRHKQLAPSLNVEKENTLFNFADSPFFIAKQTQEWQAAVGNLRRAAVSSFGFSGTNAHLVVEEYFDTEKDNQIINMPSTAKVVIPLSARTQKQLHQKAEELSKFLQNRLSSDSEKLDLQSIAYTLQKGRTVMKYRMAFVASSVEEIIEQLNQFVKLAEQAEGVYLGQATTNQETSPSLSSEQELKSMLTQWITKENYHELMKLWVKGGEINWEEFYQAGRPERMSLPTYPFAKEHYWIDVQEAEQGVIHPEKILAQNNNVQVQKQRSYYRPHWKSLSLKKSTSDVDSENILMVINASDVFVAELQNQLHTNHKRTELIQLVVGDSFNKVSDTSYSVDPGNFEDFLLLLEALRDVNKIPTQIVHLNNAPSQNLQGVKVDVVDDINAKLNSGFYLLFNLTKAMFKTKMAKPVKVISAFYSDEVHYSSTSAALSGFAKSLALENPKYACKIIELNLCNSINSDVEADPRLTVASLVSELSENDWSATEIRYQQQNQQTFSRSVREFIRYDSNLNNQLDTPLKHRGVYLITGGLGGLGIIFAEYLAKNYKAKLVLLGRSKLGQEQQAKIRQLENHGAEVLYLQSDVSTMSEAGKAVEKCKQRFANINGVIHSAGINHDSYIINKSKQEVDAVFKAKIYGTVNLDHLTRNEHLDLFVVFSSGAGSLGNAGQCDYAYANRFQDAFIEQRERQTSNKERYGKSLSIGWPYWEQGGMQVSTDILTKIENQTGMSPLPTHEGIQYWEDFIKSDLSQGLALYGIPTLIARHLGDASENEEQFISSDTFSIDSKNLLEKTKAYLVRLISDETKLAVELIETDERFEAFGFDSIMIGRFNTNLENDFGALPKTLMYEYETVDELADYLLEHSKNQLIEYFSLKKRSVSTLELELSSAREESMPVKLNHSNEQIFETSRGQKSATEAIAIIGIDGSYPHSKSLHEFWENLKAGNNLIDLIPNNRWEHQDFYDPDPTMANKGKTYSKWGGFLENFDKFDADFFNVSSDEAKDMDPQERLFLSSVWSSIEDAGYTRDSLKKHYPQDKSANVGVFVGVTSSSYHMLAADEWHRGNSITPSAMPWSIANRVSYFFDFQGPSMPIDTACSSSLVAIHLACESLMNNECQIAIAGGVNLYLHPSKYQSFCNRKMLAKGAENRSFGAGDDGFVPGEGVGSLVLKPLSRAEQDGDHIYASIAASGFEHSGRSNGYSAPNPNAQASLINNTLTKANIQAESVSYIEGHGTGTQLGDSLEIAALNQVFKSQTSKTGFCPIGSVKSNIGHSESAAGIAGVAKILLQLKYKQLVPSINATPLNPNIDFEHSPFYLQQKLSPWKPSQGNVRRAMINSFGAGGVNACLVIDEYQNSNLEVSNLEAEKCLFVLSAKTNVQLSTYIAQMIRSLQQNPGINLSELCYTLQVGREPMPVRNAIITSSVKELLNQLAAIEQQPEHMISSESGIFIANLNKSKAVKKFLNKEEKEKLDFAYTQQDLNQLATYWIAGQKLDWDKMYHQGKPRKISLPSYPFAQNRYWVADGMPENKAVKVEESTSQLHPLVSYNSSTLQAVRFSSILENNQFYSNDHLVNGQKLFPGAGFIEIANICGTIAAEQKVQKIKDIVWMEPLVFEDGERNVQTLLKTIGDATEFEISSLDSDYQRVVHSEGRLIFQNDEHPIELPDDNVSVTTFIEQCPIKLSGTQLYQKFNSHGFNYRDTFQTIKDFYASPSFALSKLQLPNSLTEEFYRYLLHPSLIDGALQTVIGLLGEESTSTPYLPFALDEVELFRPLTPICYAYVEIVDGEDNTQSEIKKFNIKILNENGKVLLNLNNFYVRALSTATSHSKVIN